MIITDDSLDAETENNISQCLKNKKLNFWHWIHNVWLITDNDYPENELKNAIRHVLPNGILLLFKIEKDNLTGFAPKDSANWLIDNWKK